MLKKKILHLKYQARRMIKVKIEYFSYKIFEIDRLYRRERTREPGQIIMTAAEKTTQMITTTSTRTMSITSALM